MAPQVKLLTDGGIPVMAHIGFTPQSEHTLGRLPGAGPRRRRLAGWSRRRWRWRPPGAFAVVMEMVPGDVAAAGHREADDPHHRDRRRRTAATPRCWCGRTPSACAPARWPGSSSSTPTSTGCCSRPLAPTPTTSGRAPSRDPSTPSERRPRSGPASQAPAPRTVCARVRSSPHSPPALTRRRLRRSGQRLGRAAPSSPDRRVSPTVRPAARTAVVQGAPPGRGGYSHVWDVKTIGAGGWLLTERDTARLRLLRNGRLRAVRVPQQQGLGLRRDRADVPGGRPHFARNRRFYTCQGGFTCSWSRRPRDGLEADHQRPHGAQPRQAARRPSDQQRAPRRAAGCSSIAPAAPSSSAPATPRSAPTPAT